MSRELGLTQDWPVVIVGIGNLGQALANYGGFGDRGLPGRRAVSTPTAAKVGTDGPRHPRRAHRRPARARGAARHRHRHHRHAGRRRPGRRRPARRRRRHVDPQLRPDGDHGARRGVAAQGRPRRRAADPQLLPAAPAPAAHRPPSLATWPGSRATDRHGRSTPGRTRSNLLLEGRRVLVVGGGARRRQKVRGLLEPRARSCTSSRPTVSRRAAGAGRHVSTSARTGRARSRGYRLAVAATDDPAVEPGRLRRRRGGRGLGQRRRRPRRAARPRSRPGSDRGRLLVTVSTAGTAPPSATWLRDQLAERVGPEHDTLLELLAEAPVGAHGRRADRPRADWRRRSIRGCWTSSAAVGSTRRSGPRGTLASTNRLPGVP